MDEELVDEYERDKQQMIAEGHVMACDSCPCSADCDLAGDLYNFDTVPMIDCLAAK